MNNHTMRTIGVLMIGGLMMIACAQVALAASPTDEQYGDNAGKVEDNVGGGGDQDADDPGSASGSNSGGSGSSGVGPGSSGGLDDRAIGSLPFTGLDLIVITLVGIALAGTGLALRHAMRGGQA